MQLWRDSEARHAKERMCILVIFHNGLDGGKTSGRRRFQCLHSDLKQFCGGGSIENPYVLRACRVRILGICVCRSGVVWRAGQCISRFVKMQMVRAAAEEGKEREEERGGQDEGGGGV